MFAPRGAECSRERRVKLHIAGASEGRWEAGPAEACPDLPNLRRQVRSADRQHARVEDRIRQAKATGLRNLPSKLAPENRAWLECLCVASDLLCWSKLICFGDDPELAHCEIANFRYRVLHMAARIAGHGRAVHLRPDRNWSWAKQLALGFSRLRAAST